MAGKIIQGENAPYGEYDHWATQEQMEKLIDRLTKSGVSINNINVLIDQLKKLNSGGKTDSDTLKKLLKKSEEESQYNKRKESDDDDFHKGQRDFWKSSRDNANKTIQALKANSIKDALRDSGQLMLAPINGMSDAFTKVSGIFMGLGSSVKNVVSSLLGVIPYVGNILGSIAGMLGTAIGGIVGGIVTIGAGLLGIVDSLGTSFLQLYNTGINLAAGTTKSGQGLARLTQAASDARMSVGAFADFIAENSRVSVAIGVDAMANLSKGVRTALLPMGSLGLTTAELNEYMGDYLETQRMLGVLGTMDQLQQQRYQQEYLMTLTQLTQVTGKHRSQLAKDMQQAMESNAYKARMLAMDEDQRAAYLKTTTALNGLMASIDPAFAKDFMDGLGRGNIMLTDFGKNLAKAGFSAEVEAMDRLIQNVNAGKMDEKSAQLEMARILELMRGNKQGMKAMAALAAVTDGTADSAIALALGLQKADFEALRAAISLRGVEGAIGSFDELMNQMQSTWTTFVAGLFADETFQKSLKGFTDKFTEILKPDGDFMKSMRGLANDLAPSLISGLESITDYMMTQDFKNMITNIPNYIIGFGKAIKAGFEYIRGIFFKQDYDEFGTGTWVVKSGDEILNGFSQMFDGVGEKVTQIIVDAFINIGAMLYDKVTGAFSNVFTDMKNAIFGGGEGEEGAASSVDQAIVGGTAAYGAYKVGKGMARRRRETRLATKAATEAYEKARLATAAPAGVKGAGKAGNLLKLAGRGAKFIPGVGLIAAAGMGAYDAFSGFNADENAGVGGSLLNAGSSLVNGLTFGLLGKSPQEIAQEAATRATTIGGGNFAPNVNMQDSDYKSTVRPAMRGQMNSQQEVQPAIDITRSLADLTATLNAYKTSFDQDATFGQNAITNWTSMSESMNNYVKQANTEQLAILGEIKDIMNQMKVDQVNQMQADMYNSKSIVKAVKESSPYVS